MIAGGLVTLIYIDVLDPHYIALNCIVQDGAMSVIEKHKGFVTLPEVLRQCRCAQEELMAS